MPIYEYRAMPAGTSSRSCRSSRPPVKTCEVCGGPGRQGPPPGRHPFPRLRLLHDRLRAVLEGRPGRSRRRRRQGASEGKEPRSEESWPEERTEGRAARTDTGGAGAEPRPARAKRPAWRPGEGMRAPTNRPGRPRGRRTRAAPASGRPTRHRPARQDHAQSIVSDDNSQLPSLSIIADAIRLELESPGQVAILYIALRRYGRLERVFGWQVTSEVLYAVARILGDVRHLLAAARRSRRLHALRQRVHGRALAAAQGRQSSRRPRGDCATCLRTAAVDPAQRSHPRGLRPRAPFRHHGGSARRRGLTFEQSLEKGWLLAMESAEHESAAYDDELEVRSPRRSPAIASSRCSSRSSTLRERSVVGYRASMRGPFYSPLRLPDVLDDVARRSSLLASYGMAARELPWPRPSVSWLRSCSSWTARPPSCPARASWR